MEPDPRPAFSRAALWIGAVVAVAHLAAVATAYGIFRDELYYLACSKRLAWGYVDHPPLSIAVLAADRALFGDGLLALRWIPAVASGALVVLVAALARELGGAARAQVIAGAAVALAPVSVGTVGFYSMNAFEPLFWTGLALLVARLAQGAGERTWLAVGAVVGLGLLNKHGLVFFLVPLIAGALATPLRRRLASPWLAAGTVVAAALVAPHLAWQIRNDWPTLEFLRNAAAHKNAPVTPSEFLAGQVLIAHPLGVPLAVLGLVALLVSRELRPFRALGLAAAATFAALMAMEAKSYYVAPMYGLLFAAGAVWIERRLGGSAWRRRVGSAYAAVYVATALLLVPFAIPVLAPERFAAYATAVGVEPPRDERQEPGILPQHFADQFGWRELAQRVSEVFVALPQAQRESCVAFAQNYGEAGALEHFARELPLPPVCCGHNSYFAWGLPPRPVQVVIVVGGDREDHLEEFESVEPAAVHDHPFAMPYERRLTIYLCRKPRRPLEECFAATRHYI